MPLLFATPSSAPKGAFRWHKWMTVHTHVFAHIHKGIGLFVVPPKALTHQTAHIHDIYARERRPVVIHALVECAQRKQVLNTEVLGQVRHDWFVKKRAPQT